MRCNGIWLATAGLALLVLVALATAACDRPAENPPAVSGFDLNAPPSQKPPENPIGRDVVSEDPADSYRARCGLCHELERGIEKYRGEEWQPIIERMMKKPGSLMNASIAGIIYVYLYERTTGELHPDREALLNPPVDTAGMGGAVGGSE